MGTNEGHPALKLISIILLVRLIGLQDECMLPNGWMSVIAWDYGLKINQPSAVVWLTSEVSDRLLQEHKQTYINR